MDNPIFFTLVGAFIALLVMWIYNMYVVIPRNIEERRIAVEEQYELGIDQGFEEALNVSFNVDSPSLYAVLGLNEKVAEKARMECYELVIKGMVGDISFGKIIEEIWRNEDWSVQYRLYRLGMLIYLSQLSVLSTDEYLDLKNDMYQEFSKRKGIDGLDKIFDSVRNRKLPTNIPGRAIIIDTKNKSDEEIHKEISQKIGQFLSDTDGKQDPPPPNDPSTIKPPDDDSLLKS